MARQGKNKDRSQSNPVNKTNNVTVVDDEEVKNTLFRYSLELAQEKYDYENQREQDLVQQSGQMQAAFSFMTAALFMALPIALDHKGSLSELFFFISFSIILFFLLVSLVLASLATWRWKKIALGNVTEIKKSILETDEWEPFMKEYHRISSKLDALEKVQVRKETINNRRASLIHSSMIAFYLSIGSIVVSYITSLVILF